MRQSRPCSPPRAGLQEEHQMLLQAQSAIGLVALPLMAWGLWEKRAALAPRPLARIVTPGARAHLPIPALMLHVPAAPARVDWAAGLVAALQPATTAGVRLVFGYLAGGAAPFDVSQPQNSFILAFQALPLVLVISALSRLFYHWGVLQWVVRSIGRGLQRALGVS